eukprot:1471989-Amphidinium_carterae.1
MSGCCCLAVLNFWPWCGALEECSPRRIVSDCKGVIKVLHWELVAKSVRNFRLLVGRKLRERPEAWLRVRLPTCLQLKSSRTFPWRRQRKTPIE